MLNLPTPAEAEAIAEPVCQDVNDTVPWFNVNQPDPEIARQTGRGNCFAMTVESCLRLDALEVPFYFRQQGKQWFDIRKYHHADLVIPVSSPNIWGLVLEMVSNAPHGDHMQYRPLTQHPVTQRSRNITAMATGRTILMEDNVPGFGNATFRAASFAVGHREYCRRTGLTNRGRVA